MAKCGIARIDNMNAGIAGVASIGPGDSDKDSVGVIQDFLTGHGKGGLPNLLSSSYGIFGPITTAAAREFRAERGLPDQDDVDQATLQQLVSFPAVAPRCSRGYLALVLDFPYSGMIKVLSLVSQMEGAGRFAALNLNSDRAGLSFGLIQWAQKPGRLPDILTKFRDTSASDFVRIFGAGDSQLANDLIAHTQKPFGGVDRVSGETTDPVFDLVREPWVSRFREAATLPAFQPVQVSVASVAFNVSFGKLQRFAPSLTSERSVAFMIDLANQFGDAGAQSVFSAVQRTGMPEPALLAAMAAESVNRMPDRFKQAVRARRDNFLNTTFLSDGPFSPGALIPAGT